MQLTKLEVKRRNLDTENLQVGVPAFFLFPSCILFYTFYLLSLKNYILSFLHDNIFIAFTLLQASSHHGHGDSTESRVYSQM